MLDVSCMLSPPPVLCISTGFEHILQILFGMGTVLYFISGTLPDEIGKFEARPVSIDQ